MEELLAGRGKLSDLIFHLYKMKDNTSPTCLQEKTTNHGKNVLVLRLELLALLRQNGRFMGTSFSPTRQDVERYRSLRALSMERNHRIIKTFRAKPRWPGFKRRRR